jgi:hypothetical protein
MAKLDDKPKPISTAELKLALRDRLLMRECIGMIQLAMNDGQEASVAMSAAIGYFILSVTGEVDRPMEANSPLGKTNLGLVFYDRVYDLLVYVGGASERERETFISMQMADRPCSEYRFQGIFGFGGKYWHKENCVTCSTEDEVPTSLHAVECLNDALARLADAMGMKVPIK